MYKSIGSNKMKNYTEKSSTIRALVLFNKKIKIIFKNHKKKIDKIEKWKGTPENHIRDGN